MQQQQNEIPDKTLGYIPLPFPFFFFFLSTDKTQEEILPTEKINNSSINSLFYFLHDVKVSQVLLNKPSKLTPSFFN